MTPVNLDSYISWANAQRSGLKRVVLSDAGGTESTVLRKASARLSRYVRFRHSAESRALARDVNSDFRNALEARFSGLADQVLDTVMGQKLIDGRSYGTAKLTARKIKKAVSLAERLQNEALRRPAAAVRNPALPNLPPGFASVRLLTHSPQTVRLLQRFGSMHAQADELMSECPLTPEGLKDLRVRAQKFSAGLRDLPSAILKRNDIGNAPDIFALQEEVADVRKQVSERIDMLEAILRDKPISYAQVQQSRLLWLESAKNTCLALTRDPKVPPETAATLHALADGSFFDALEAMERGNPRPPELAALSPELKKLAEDFAPDYSGVTLMHTPCPRPDAYVRDLRGQLEKLIRQAVSLSAGDRSGARLSVGKTLMHELQNTLNRQPWKPVRKTFGARIGHEHLEVGSSITPARNLGPAMEAVYHDVNGVMSHSYDETRAVNLNASELTLTDRDGVCQVAFRGMRHGVHCALEIKDPAERAAANLNRAENTAVAAFLSRPDLIRQALQTPDRTIDLPMTSLSLLTPDAFRSGESGEKAMLLEQVKAWDALNALGRNGGVRVDVPDPANPQQTLQVTLRPKVVAFNFGVNEGAVKFGALSYIAGGWHTSDSINRVGMEAMKQRVDGFLAGCRDARTADAVRTLWTQVNTVTDSRAQHRDRGDAYKAVSRLAVMSWLMGDVPCWNCKSGKDRTGEMDVECKFLAALIARGQEIPEPGADLTDEQRALFTSLALLGGNHEIQEYNTTLAGFKTGSVESIARRLGSAEASALHTGAAEFVKV